MIYIYRRQTWLFIKKEFIIQVLKSFIIFDHTLKTLLEILKDLTELYDILWLCTLSTLWRITIPDDTCGICFNFNFYFHFYSILNYNFIQHYMSCFILWYKFIKYVYINTICMYNYHKLLCCIVVAFCISCILYVLWVFLICMFSCLYITYVTI